jgi:ATP:cob(I)alamin adenosyltransferase
MGITTKKGDQGITSLYSGERVSKDDIRVEAYGTLDELCSFLGLSKSLIKNRKAKRLLESIQQDLFVIGAELAVNRKFFSKLEKRINNSYIGRLEKITVDLEKKKQFKECCFYLPGENCVCATLDIARTVTRRAERLVVTLKKKGILLNSFILIYLNRLSDLLYLLARSYGKNHRKLKSR